MIKFQGRIIKNKALSKLLQKARLQRVLTKDIDKDLLQQIEEHMTCDHCKYYVATEGGKTLQWVAHRCVKIGAKDKSHHPLIVDTVFGKEIYIMVPSCDMFEEV